MKLRHAVSAACAAACCTLAVAQAADYKMVKPGDLKWEDAPSLPKGAKIAVVEGPLGEAVPFTARLKLPANYRIPPHWHPAAERVTVISGGASMGMGDKFDTAKMMAVEPGDLMIIQPKNTHYVQTKAETVVQINGMGPWGITYVNPADDPRKK